MNALSFISIPTIFNTFVLQVTNLNTGATNYVQQTGTNTVSQPTYCTPTAYPVNTNYVCSGTLVTNSDGTRSCVTTVGTSSTGYPISQVNQIEILFHLAILLYFRMIF